MASQVLVLHLHPSATPTLMLRSSSGFLPLAYTSPGLQSPRNRLKSATWHISFSTLFKSQLGLAQLAFSVYYITAKGEEQVICYWNTDQLYANNPMMVLGFVNGNQSTTWPSRTQGLTFSFSHTFRFQNKHDLFVFGEKCYSLLETGTNKVLFLACVPWL